jgi:hypothetical protein
MSVVMWYRRLMAHRRSLPIEGMNILVLVSAALGGLLSCAAPALDRGSAPPEPASSRPAALPEATTAPSAPPVPAATVSAPALAPTSAAVEPPAPTPDAEPATQSPEQARGQCSGRTTLKTKRGEVSCYPYRCRAGKCLLSCKTREDCAGSMGPAEMAEYGWPLDCATLSATCYPLPPDHVQPH